KLGEGWGNGTWQTRFTPEEQRTMMTLWCIFRSPLMIGTDLPQLDDAAKDLLTNREVLWVQRFGRDAHQVMRDESQCIWASYGGGCPASGMQVYVALFNLSDKKRDVSVRLSDIAGIQAQNTYQVRNLWDKKDMFPLAGDSILSLDIGPHGSVLLKLS
nr:hypothetical protein [Treponema sp.]